MGLMSEGNRYWVLGIALLVGMGGILYGYDIGVISGALLFVHKAIPMTMTQTGLIVGAVLGGGLVGTLLAGPCADLWGRRVMIGASSVVFILGVICILSAHSFVTLLVARLLLGVGVGIVAVAVPLYVTEIVPAKDRGAYVTFFQLFLTFGILLAYGVDLLLTPYGAWRLMFALVLIPALILLIGVFRLPESPRWLVAQNRQREARQVLCKTHSPQSAESELIHIATALDETRPNWSELFTARMVIPLVIAIGVAILNQWTGINAFLQYAPGLLKQAGLASDWAAMLGSLSIGALNFICTIIGVVLVDRLGRRPLLLIGLSGVLFAEIFLWVANSYIGPSLALAICNIVGLLVFISFFAIGPGVVVWLVISELFPTRIRGLGIALCLFFSSLSGWALSSAFPLIVNSVGLSGAYAICAACSFIYWLLTYRMLPETKGKTLEQIQRYFHQQA